MDPIEQTSGSVEVPQKFVNLTGTSTASPERISVDMISYARPELTFQVNQYSNSSAFWGSIARGLV